MAIHALYNKGFSVAQPLGDGRCSSATCQEACSNEAEATFQHTDVLCYSIEQQRLKCEWLRQLGARRCGSAATEAIGC